METVVSVQDERWTQLRDLVADLLEATPEETVQAASFADDLSADSFLLIEMSAQLEREFSVEFAQDDLPKMVNLTTTYQLIAERAGW